MVSGYCLSQRPDYQHEFRMMIYLLVRVKIMKIRCPGIPKPHARALLAPSPIDSSLCTQRKLTHEQNIDQRALYRFPISRSAHKDGKEGCDVYEYVSEPLHWQWKVQYCQWKARFSKEKNNLEPTRNLSISIYHPSCLNREGVSRQQIKDQRLKINDHLPGCTLLLSLAKLMMSFSRMPEMVRDQTTYYKVQRSNYSYQRSTYEPDLSYISRQMRQGA